MKAVIIILVVQLCVMQGGCSACGVTQIGVVTCVYGCANCNNGTCVSCCSRYYPLANNCIACTDLNCIACTQSGSEICSTCTAGYAPSITFPTYCYACNENTDSNCQSVNNCSLSSSCVTCRLYGLNAASMCQLCQSNYRHCFTCDNSVCLSCNVGYALNVSSGSMQFIMKISNAWLAIFQCAPLAQLGLSAHFA